MSWGLRAASSS